MQCAGWWYAVLPAICCTQQVELLGLLPVEQLVLTIPPLKGAVMTMAWITIAHSACEVKRWGLLGISCYGSLVGGRKSHESSGPLAMGGRLPQQRMLCF